MNKPSFPGLTFKTALLTSDGNRPALHTHSRRLLRGVDEVGRVGEHEIFKAGLEGDGRRLRRRTPDEFHHRVVLTFERLHGFPMLFVL